MVTGLLPLIDVLHLLIDLADGIGAQTQAGGVRSYLQLAALISVNLGIFNMLPIPGLDGSKLIFLLVEKIRGRRIPPEKESIVVLIGFGLLLLLMALVMYQDIVRLFK